MSNHYATRRDLQALKELLMSVIGDKIAALAATTDDAISRVQTDVSSLTAKVATLEAEVAAGTASQADIDALNAIQGKLDALDPTSPATLPAEKPAS